MTVEDRLRLHLADKGATWRNETTGTYAAWTGPEGPCALVLLPQPLNAAAIVDAYVARPAGARLTLVHEGPLSPVALRSASRFGIQLLDAATLPMAVPAPVVHAPAAPAAPTRLPAHETPLLLAPHTAEPRLPAPEVQPLLPAGEAPDVLPPAEAPVETTVPVEDAVSVPVQGPPAAAETAVTLPEASAPALVIEGPLPWDHRVPVVEPTPAVEVTAGELAALPWHDHAPIEEHVEILAGTPRSRRHVDRPTVAGAPGWGLPWPRPVPQTDGLSIADPRIWGAQERMHAVREDLERKGGASSFGAVRPEGSAWLKRVQDFGAP